MNSSIFSRNFKKISDSNEYINYYLMLVDYDFFDHLVLRENRNEKISLKKSAEEITNSIFNACIGEVISYGNLERNELTQDSHINCIDKYFENHEFYICIAYDLKNKYISSPAYPEKTGGLREVLPLLIKSYHSKLSINELHRKCIAEIDEIIKDTIATVIENNNTRWFNHNSGSHGFFDSPQIINWLIENIRVSKKIIDLAYFKNTYRDKLKVIASKDSTYYQNENYYERSIDINLSRIITQLDGLIENIILINVKTNNLKIINNIFIKKSNETSSRINKYLSPYIMKKFRYMTP